MSREEQELQDVERQMELQLIDQHMELERIVQIRPQNGDVGFLCKWKGLPYSEATWEEKKFVVEMNASDKVEAYQVSHDAASWSISYMLYNQSEWFLANNQIQIISVFRSMISLHPPQ